MIDSCGTVHTYMFVCFPTQCGLRSHRQLLFRFFCINNIYNVRCAVLYISFFVVLINKYMSAYRRGYWQFWKTAWKTRGQFVSKTIIALFKPRDKLLCTQTLSTKATCHIYLGTRSFADSVTPIVSCMVRNSYSTYGHTDCM